MPRPAEDARASPLLGLPAPEAAAEDLRPRGRTTDGEAAEGLRPPERSSKSLAFSQYAGVAIVLGLRSLSRELSLELLLRTLRKRREAPPRSSYDACGGGPPRETVFSTSHGAYAHNESFSLGSSVSAFSLELSLQPGPRLQTRGRSQAILLKLSSSRKCMSPQRQAPVLARTPLLHPRHGCKAQQQALLLLGS